ncbi:Calcium-independent phospholipase A2-gamma [Babesia sp. Xinjiang]|uniref:Calcium-independent phospholipase A2-gamma n=1 Tax=Babesia sp. Xinjiang TaxID=462227 RepID=UPI000A222F8A|nr:Calcium-independent phospholipase A2-gamma [Babesia sp. Xinjiang]XP_028872591.1 Calcium-independent phospholipase A2-gamma [Babesia sp. Xinjiang]ORM42096.1 Calcium-independent phospholipase A2-gamma [Babesia sp. Xinjiang]ORM42135.1 Calcium-independent phospholipase A2-gamma [Babesia sp. Xinjiang]
MWFMLSVKQILLTLVCLGILSRWQSPQGTLLLPSLVASAEKVNTPAFVTTSAALRRTSKGDEDTNKEHKYRAVLKEEQKSIDSPDKPDDASVAETTSEGDTIPDDLSTVGSSSEITLQNECSSAMAHIEELLLRNGSSKDITNKHVALNTLRLIVQTYPTCIRKLQQETIDAFSELLQQRFKRNFWQRLRSCLGRQTPLKLHRRALIEANVLTILLEISRRNAKLRKYMAQNKNLRNTLLRIYFSGYKGRKKGDASEGKAKKHSETATDNSTGDSTDKDQGHNTDTHKDAISQSDDTKHSVWSAKYLVRELFRSFGYANYNSIVSQYEKLRATAGLGENACYDVQNFIMRDKTDNEDSTTNDELEESQTSNSEDSSLNGDDSQLLWVPYCLADDADPVKALRRNMRINLGPELAESVNLDALCELTVDKHESPKEPLTFGVVVLCKATASGAISCAPNIPSPADASTTPLTAKGGEEYKVVSNIILGRSELINGVKLATQLMQQLVHTDTLYAANDIISELWTLVASGDTEVIEVVHQNLDLDFLTDVLNRTLLFSDVDDLDVVPPADEDEKSIIAKFFVVFRNIWGSVKRCMNKVVPVKDSLNCNRFLTNEFGTTDVFKTNNDDSTGSIPPSSSSEEEASVLATLANAKIARRLQTAIFGLLIDMVYFHGARSLATITKCSAFVDAMKAVRETFPEPAKLIQAVDEHNKRVAPLVDRRRFDPRKKTSAIRRPVLNVDQTTMENLRWRDRDEYGNPEMPYSQWEEESWMRQRTVPTSALGPFVNGHKLLNMLGHHDQTRIKGRGLRILSIDGGGSKGVVTLEILAELEEKLGKPLYEAFDFIVGTSCGGIIGALLALERSRVSEIQTHFDKMLAEVFKTDSYHSRGKRMITQHAYYDEKVLYNVLKKTFGPSELIDYSVDPDCPKFCCLSVQFDIYPFKPIVWRNYNYHPKLSSVKNASKLHDGSFAIGTADALRATTAAPTYFPLMEVNGALYADGALYANNPSMVGLIEATLAYPDIPIDCMVSIGNGDWHEDIFPGESKDMVERVSANLGENKDCLLDVVADVIDAKDVILNSPGTPPKCPSPSVGLERMLQHLIFSATDTEMVHLSLQELMDKNKYFRINPPIPLVGMAEVDPEVLSDIKERAQRFMAEKQQQDVLKKIREVMLPKAEVKSAKASKDS